MRWVVQRETYKVAGLEQAVDDGSASLTGGSDNRYTNWGHFSRLVVRKGGRKDGRRRTGWWNSGTYELFEDNTTK